MKQNFEDDFVQSKIPYWYGTLSIVVRFEFANTVDFNSCKSFWTEIQKNCP